MVSVIIPSILCLGSDGVPMALRAARSARSQPETREILLAVGSDAMVPGVLADAVDRVVRYDGPTTQSELTNAAVEAAACDVVALLDDDDEWVPGKLAIQTALIGRYDLVTSCWHDPASGDTGAFPVPSGWVITKAAWVRVGGFRTPEVPHNDNVFLGLATVAAIKRVHVAPRVPVGRCARELAVLTKLSVTDISSNHTEPLIIRHTRSDGLAASWASVNYDAIVREFGRIPW